MEKLLETLGNNKLITKEQMKEYFDEIANNKEVLFDYLSDKPYKLEFDDNEKCKKLMHFDSKTNTYTFNLAWFNILHLDLLADPHEYNLYILDYLHTMLADIELRKNIKNGCLHLYEPEVFVCLVNEFIDPFNAKDKLVRNNYCSMRVFEYNTKALDEACKKYGLPRSYYDNYVAYSNNRIKEKVNKEGNSTLEEAILYENTPSTMLLFTDFLELRKYKKEIIELFGEKVYKKYNTAVDLFMKRGYIKMAGTLYSKFMSMDYPTMKELKEKEDLNVLERFIISSFGRYENNEDELDNVPLMNKLLFGKRLNEDELETIDIIVDTQVPITYVCDQFSDEEVRNNVK